jgi:hypothetical protein
MQATLICCESWNLLAEFVKKWRKNSPCCGKGNGKSKKNAVFYSASSQVKPGLKYNRFLFPHFYWFWKIGHTFTFILTLYISNKLSKLFRKVNKIGCRVFHELRHFIQVFFRIS